MPLVQGAGTSAEAGNNVIGQVKITNGTLTVSVLDLTNSDPLAVAIVDGSGTQITSFGGGVQHATNDPYTDTDVGTLALAVRQDAQSDLGADGDFVPLSIDANGALRVTGGGGGTEYTDGAAPPANPVGPTMVWNDNGAWKHISLAAPLPTSTSLDISALALAANQLPDGHNVTVDNASIAVTGTFWQATQPISHAALTALGTAINSNLVDVNIVSGAGSGGTAAADDADFTAGTTQGTPAMGVYESSPTSVTDGDLGTVGITQTRALRTAVEGSVAVTNAGLTELAAAINGSSQMDVNVAAGSVTANAGTNLNTSALLTTAAHDAAFGTAGTADAQVRTIQGVASMTPVQVSQATAATLNMTEASAAAILTAVQLIDDTVFVDDTATHATGTTKGIGIMAVAVPTDTAIAANDIGMPGMSLDRRLYSEAAGNIAHDVADAGNPVKIGAVAYSPDGTTPGTAIVEGRRSNLKSDLDGLLFTSRTTPRAWHYHDDDAAAVTTDGTLQADPGDGFAVFIETITFSIGAATASTLFIEEGSTKIWGPHNLPATIGAGFSITLNPPLRCTASTAILITNTGSINFAIDVDGFIAAV